MADLQFRATGVLLNPYASKRPATSIAFSRARSRQICRCRHRTSTSSSSTSRPPRRWVSKCHRRCSRGLFLRHIGKFNKLASVRERDPGVSHTHIIFAHLAAVSHAVSRLDRIYLTPLSARPSPSRSQCYDHVLYSGSHLFVVGINLSRAVFIVVRLSPICERRRSKLVVLNYPHASPKT